MKEKWAVWPVYRRAMLLATAGILAFFAVLYPIVGRQKGVKRNGDFYGMTAVGETKLYVGTIHSWIEGHTVIQSGDGREAVYAVTPVSADDIRVECQIGEETFGPFRVTKYPLAQLPGAGSNALNSFPIPFDTGLEIKNTITGETLFRGGYRLSGDYTSLISGTITTEGDPGSASEHMTVDGVTYFDYAPASPEKGPGPYDLTFFALEAEEELTHKGNVGYFALALLVAVLNAASIVWAEELFVWSMSFQVADPESVEPSEWEIFPRHVGWGLFLLMELIVLIMGLTSVA